MFNYFKTLRNKHFVHDENSYAQAKPGAILSNMSKPYKVEKVVCQLARKLTLEQDTYNNLELLVQQALAWVVFQFDAVCDQISADLETKSREELASLPELRLTTATLNDVSKRRNAP